MRGNTMRRWRMAIGATAMLAVAATAAAPAQAEFGFQSEPTIQFHAPQDAGVFDMIVEGDGPPLVPDTQAGGHPDLTVSFKLNEMVVPESTEGPMPDGRVRDVIADTVAGFYGNPQNRPFCTWQEFAANKGWCDLNAQVGLAVPQTNSDPSQGILYKNPLPIYNIEPNGDETAVLAFSLGNVVTKMAVTPRTDGDYGLRTTVSGVTQTATVYGARVTLWGDPSDPIHDRLRPKYDPSTTTTDWNFDFDTFEQRGWPSTAPRLPFLSAPARCDGPLTTALRISSWQDPSRMVGFEAISPTRTGCDRLKFKPAVDVAPTSLAAGRPSGYRFGVTVPQTNSIHELATPQVKDVTVALPEGTTISPAAADGLEACSDAQVGLKSKEPELCPDASKIGAVRVETPLLDRPLQGALYTATQQSDDPRSGRMYRVFLVAFGSGVRVKLEGGIKADPVTGQLTATFENNPQLPFSRLEVDLKGGSRAPLANPTSCGTKTTAATISSWADHSADLTSSFDVECPGSGGFAPTLAAGASNPTAGAFAPFVVQIGRPDGQEYLDGVSIELPSGVLAKLKGVALCPDAQANAGTCDSASRVGSATVGAGAGPTPFYLRDQPVYLGGPYKGAPYSLAVATRAIAGPFDLGTIVVRQALRIDPVDAHVTVDSDPIPTIRGGVPLSLRSVAVEVDRPDFSMNPTSCVVKQVKATLHSQQGSSSAAQSRFQVGDCASLGFTPRLAMRLTGKGQTRTGGHPALKALLTQPNGQANISRAAVTLPKSIVLDPSNSTDPKLVCGYDEGLKADCPTSSIIGKATAHTPVLNRPLTGNVHLVQGIRFGPKGNRIRTTPTLLVKLRGEVAIDLRAKTSVERNRLVTTFPEAPDARVSKFSMSIDGGSKGILVVTRTAKAKLDICDAKQIANVDTDGHNGREANFNTTVKTPCAKAKKAKSKKK